VLIPGDPERELEAIRRIEGIPLLKPVVEDLQSLASRFQLDFKLD
jgi:LDH2 family malate/lactate/ureidoglycolate dehydrogenase